MTEPNWKNLTLWTGDNLRLMCSLQFVEGCPEPDRVPAWPHVAPERVRPAVADRATKRGERLFEAKG